MYRDFPKHRAYIRTFSTLYTRMSSIEYILEPCQSVFHGTNTELHTLVDGRELWTALKEHGAKQYGSNVFELKPKRRLRLLNVTSPIFHADIMGHANVKYTENNGMDENKMLLLAPLGLPNLSTQLKVLGEIQGGLYKPQNDQDASMLDYITLGVGYFGNCHRYSKTSTDTMMIKMIKEMYPNYDGIISPIMWPSIHHGGYLVAEMCVFDGPQCVEIKRKMPGGRRLRQKKVQKRGGGPTHVDERFTPHTEPKLDGNGYIRYWEEVEGSGMATLNGKGMIPIVVPVREPPMSGLPILQYPKSTQPKNETVYEAYMKKHPASHKMTSDVFRESRQSV